MSFKLNFLVAIPYCSKDVQEYLKTIEADTFMLLDSGAFTAWKKGKEMNLDTYIEFIQNSSLKFWKYFTCDVVGNPKRTRENYDSLLRQNFKPIPIFTRGDELSSLEYFFDTSDFIALGGLVGTQGNKGFVKGIMKTIGDRKDKVHWLGFTQTDFLTHYKPFSCDSSSWSMALRYGTLDLYIGKGKWRRFKRNDFLTRPSIQILRLFDDYEEDVAGFRFESEWKNTGRSGADKKLLARIAYKAWARYQLDVEKFIGVKFFLSCGEIAQFWLFHEAHHFWKSKFPSMYSVGSETPDILNASPLS